MSEVSYCHCGKRGALFQRTDTLKLIRMPHCVEHTKPEDYQGLTTKAPFRIPQMPPLFDDTDIKLLNPTLQQHIDWVPQGQRSSLLVRGVSGCGKTRMLWLIVNKMWAEAVSTKGAYDVMFLTMRQMEGLIEGSFGERKHGEMLDRLIKCDLLVFDDFGKERLTQRMAADLFCVIDERSINYRPTLISTNYVFDELMKRFDVKDGETSAAMIRRFRDYYTIVRVGA